MLTGLLLTVSRTGTSEVPQRKSPVTPRTARQLKTPNADSDSVSSSPNPARKTPKDRSPKVIERRSPQSPISEVFEVTSCLDLNYATLMIETKLSYDSCLKLFKFFVNLLSICICKSKIFISLTVFNFISHSNFAVHYLALEEAA